MSGGQLVAVDRFKTADQFYRYKMPAIVVKSEGSGNGIKTVFPNIREVCSRLQRPPTVLNKFFGYELGAQATHFANTDKFQVMGAFTQQRVQEKVYDFVDKFVLCGSCRNPETTLSRHKNKESVAMTCKACQHVSTFPPSERCAQQFLAWVKEQEEEKQKAAAAAAAAPKSKEPNAMATDTTDITVSTEPLAKEPAIEGNASDILANFMAESTSFKAQADKIFELKSQFNIEDGGMPKFIFRGLVSHMEARENAPEGDSKSDGAKPSVPFISQLRTHERLLKKFVTGSKQRRQLLNEVLRFCKRHQLPEKVPMACKMLFEEGVVTDEDCFEWFGKAQAFAASTNAKQSEDRKFMGSTARLVAPLIAWLKGQEVVAPSTETTT